MVGSESTVKQELNIMCFCLKLHSVASWTVYECAEVYHGNPVVALKINGNTRNNLTTVVRLFLVFQLVRLFLVFLLILRAIIGLVNFQKSRSCEVQKNMNLFKRLVSVVMCFEFNLNV